MVDAFEAQVVLPALALGHGAPRGINGRDLEDETWVRSNDLARAMLQDGQTFVKTISRSAAWHARWHRIDHAIAATPAGTSSTSSWPPGFPDWSGQGVEIVVLADKAALVDEGRRGPDDAGMGGSTIASGAMRGVVPSKASASCPSARQAAMDRGAGSPPPRWLSAMGASSSTNCSGTGTPRPPTAPRGPCEPIRA